MELKILEESDGKVRVEVAGETHTLLNILRANAWKAGADQASYMIRHPLLSQPELIIRARNPRKVLKDSAQMLVENAKELREEAKKVFK